MTMAGRLSMGGQTPEEVAAITKALADPNRLRILDLLMEGDSCNCELNEKLGLPPNLLSHHLRVLRQVGLLCSRRDAMDARWIYYAVNKQVVTYWRAWFNEFLDPARVQERATVCGPEGQQVAVDPPPQVGYPEANSASS
jgi:ArsR family transcriptional regulator